MVGIIDKVGILRQQDELNLIRRHQAKRDQKMAINYVCRDLVGRIIKKEGDYIGVVAVLITKTLAIQNVLKQAIEDKILKCHH